MDKSLINYKRSSKFKTTLVPSFKVEQIDAFLDHWKAGMKGKKAKDEYGSQANLVDNMAPPDISADKNKEKPAVLPRSTNLNSHP